MVLIAFAFFFVQLGSALDEPRISQPYGTLAECQAAQQVVSAGVRYGPEGAQYEADGLRQATVSECFARPGRHGDGA